MATITSSLALQDRMSAPLNTINKNLGNTTKGFESLAGKIVTFNAVTQIYNTISNGVRKLMTTMDSYVAMGNVQVENEARLATVMRQRMNATDDQINSIKELASAEQALGIYGDDMILAGAQELATYINQKDALNSLIPAMNNLLAQQRGYNANAQDMVSTATMMGKVLSGQTSALSRVGYVFSDAEKKALELGDEMERAAVLAQIIERNVGRMNQALAETPMGKIIQLQNLIGDMKEELGVVLTPFKQAITLIQLDIQRKFIDVMIRGVEWIRTNIVQLANTFSILLTAAVTAATGIAIAWAVVNWQLTLIIVAIGAISIAINDMVGTSVDGSITMAKTYSVLGGILSGISSIIINIVLTVRNAIAVLINFGATIGELLANFFINPFKAIGNFMFSLLDNILQVVQLAGGLLGKTELTEGIESARTALNKLSEDWYGENKIKGFRMELMHADNVVDAIKKGAGVGKDMGGSFDAIIKQLQDLKPKDDKDKNKYDSNGALVTSVTNDLSINNDDLQLLHDLAIRDYQVQYQQITPNFTLQGVTIRETADVDNVFSYIADKIQELTSTRLTAGI